MDHSEISAAAMKEGGKTTTGSSIKSFSQSGSDGAPHDAEKQVRHDQPEGLKRKLKSRHLQMIAIGGTIGTGLFIGSGGAIAKSGPAGALIAYIFVGTIIYSVMTSLGEMATYMPVTGAFTAYATRFVDPSLGFAMGWIYWFSWAMTYALELTVTGLIIQYWAPNLSIAIFIAVFWVLISILNMLPVSFYGEFEFGLSMVKVITVLGFIIFAICIAAGAGQQGVIGFDNWRDPGAFAPYLSEQVGDGAMAKFVGFWAVLIQAGFSYQGTELVGIAAGETENPRKNVPAAIKKTFYRILFFFVVTIFCIGLLVPYTNEGLISDKSDATASPFVIAAKLAGVKVLPGVINAVLLFVVISAANSNVYSGSRILLGLANDGSAPAFLKRTTKSGVPYFAVIVTSLFGFLAFLNLSNSAAVVFNWFLNITAVAGFITWACINGCHIAFMRALAARNISRDTLPYKAFWEPWFAYYGLFFNILIILTQGFTAFLPWDVSSFFTAYVSVILFVVLFVGHKLIMRTTYVRVGDVDLDTDASKDDDATWSIEDPTTIWGKFWAWMC
ncbi:probable arginine transporter [Rhynchosporium secalis]|uniref:Probable arginine transporter n=1 Tax=Rhynchosporium secalis TaxID=38038 RepID=A0A1E1MLR1_RHYSE|nr:probable arginine transporter [Rhynchosporium secalis]